MTDTTTPKPHPATALGALLAAGIDREGATTQLTTLRGALRTLGEHEAADEEVAAALGRTITSYPTAQWPKYAEPAVQILTKAWEALQQPEPEPQAPPAPAIHDSDLIYLAIRRLDRVASKMQAFEYDDELQAHIARAAELLDWATWNISNRNTSDDPKDHPDA